MQTVCTINQELLPVKRYSLFIWREIAGNNAYTLNANTGQQYYIAIVFQ